MFNIQALLITMIYLADIILFVPKYTQCKYNHTSRTRKLVWKGICIGCAFLILLFGTIVNGLTGSLDCTGILIVVAMLLCAVGDIVLEIRFVRGGVLFFLGHLFYVAVMVSLQKSFCITSIIVFVIMVVLGTFLTVTKLGKKYRFLLICYNIIISASFSLAIPVILTFRPANVLLGTGVMFLVISDWILARNKSLGSTYNWSLAALVLYFGGQILVSTYPFLI